ncbi:MAG: hypothetical protein U0517_01235 [Candidatus Andersenbacteria bacterium]
MLELLRWLTQTTFTVLYAIIMVLTAVFVLPVVLLKDWLAIRQNQRKVALLLMVVAVSLGLAGCTINFDQTKQRVQDSLGKSKEIVDRSVEFARTAPEVPYQPLGETEHYKPVVADNDLYLSADQLAHIAGAAAAVHTEPALVATIIEQELRWLEDNELERDVLTALSGEDSSIGLAQVRVSTAEELEQEDPAGLLPQYQTGDTARTERIRRLANANWSILYAASYVRLLEQRYAFDAPLDIAQRYIGASPNDPQTGDQARLFDMFSQLFK